MWNGTENNKVQLATLSHRRLMRCSIQTRKRQAEGSPWTVMIGIARSQTVKGVGVLIWPREGASTPAGEE